MDRFDNPENYTPNNMSRPVFHGNIASQDNTNVYDPYPAHMPPSEALSLAKKKQLLNKRAAQNRAAQKAFRQRKDQHIKDLEAKAKLLVIREASLRTAKKELERLKARISELEGETIRHRKSMPLTPLAKALNSDPYNQASNHSNSDNKINSSEAELSNLFDLKAHRTKFTSALPMGMFDPDELEHRPGSIPSLGNIALNSSMDPDSHDLLCPNCNNLTSSPFCLCPRPTVQFPLLAGRRFKWIRAKNHQGLWRWSRQNTSISTPKSTPNPL